MAKKHKTVQPKKLSHGEIRRQEFRRRVQHDSTPDLRRQLNLTLYQIVDTREQVRELQERIKGLKANEAILLEQQGTLNEIIGGR